MRNFVIFGAAGGELPPAAAAAPALCIDEMVVRSAIVETADPAFDPGDAAQAPQVLVRVDAFSCNFRDKGFMLRLQQMPPDRFFAIGSELCGTVVEVGAGVRDLRPGDRVIGQNHYTGRLVDGQGVAEGLPTNQASRELQRVHASKLARVPDAMTAEQGAAFAVGAQTAYSMVRRLEVREGERVLVTSAASNTSLFAIAALAMRGARVFATTTSRGFDERLRALGVETLVHLGGDDGGFAENAELARLARETGGFDCVVDPYFDLHLEASVALMAPFGRYTTCGILNQNPALARRAGLRPMNAESIMVQAMLRNLSIIGNCIGVREDLERALDDYAAGRLGCVVDSVYGGGRTAEFLERTYNDRGRFGKVVYRY